MPKSNLFPTINEILSSPMIKPLVDHLHPAAVITTARGVMDEIRTEMMSVATEMRMPDISELVQRILARLKEQVARLERPLINASGQLYHSEFGNPPLAFEVIERMLAASDRGEGALCTIPTEQPVASPYAFSHDSAVLMLKELTQAEDAIVLESVVAAQQLVAFALAGEKETLLSRSESYESERGYRLVDLLRLCGTTVFEVGASNRTTLEDYRNGLSDRTGLVYLASRGYNSCRLALENERLAQRRREKFEESFGQNHASSEEEKGEILQNVVFAELSDIMRQEEIPILLELQFAAFRDLGPLGLKEVPVLSRCLVEHAADLVICTGGGLIGGPECGILLGRRHWIEAIRKHPLLPAFLPGPMSLAGLQAALEIHLAKDFSGDVRIPLMQLLSTSLDNLRNRANRLAPQITAIPGIAEVFYTTEPVPVFGEDIPLTLPGCQLHLRPNGQSAKSLAEALLRGSPGVVVAVRGGVKSKQDSGKGAASPGSKEEKVPEYFRAGRLEEGINPFGENGDWIVIDLRSVPAKFDLPLLEALNTRSTG